MPNNSTPDPCFGKQKCKMCLPGTLSRDGHCTNPFCTNYKRCGFTMETPMRNALIKGTDARNFGDGTLWGYSINRAGRWIADLVFLGL
jgi:hypothetical protein